MVAEASTKNVVSLTMPTNKQQEILDLKETILDLEYEVTIYRKALLKISDSLGQTCVEFPACKHVQCVASRSAKVVAAMALDIADGKER